MKYQQPEVKRFPKHSAYEWKKIIQEFDQSALSIDEFCRHESLGKETFKKWRTHYSKSRKPVKKKVSPSGFIEIVDSSSAKVPTKTIDIPRAF